MKNEYYNYVYLDPRKPGEYKYGEYKFDYEPFYIGKGKNKRHFDHLKENTNTTCNKYKFNKISKIKKETGYNPIVEILFKNLTEQKAFDNEIDLINVIGRKHVGGPLTNLTDGGEGTTGYKRTPEDNEKTIKNLVIKIYQYDLDLNYIKAWDSIANATRSIKGENIRGYDSHIIKCCKGELNSSCGYHWSYKKYTNKSEIEAIKNKIIHVNGRRSSQSVVQMDENRNIVSEYSSISKASRDTGITRNMIIKCCKNLHGSINGYIFEYKK